MPYIKKESRTNIDGMIDQLARLLSEFDQDKVDGALNYTVSTLLNKLYKDKYFDFNRALGVLNAITLEFYRRKVAPYEDVKIEKNGDVFSH